MSTQDLARHFRHRLLSIAFCLVAALIAGAASEPPALAVTRISIAESQILIQFNRAVAPLGRMERAAEELPITIEPQVNCHWRWISAAALACNLSQGDWLKPAHEYAVTVAPGIRAMDGATTSQTVTRSRVMDLPEVARVLVQTWTSPGTPVFRVLFNQPVTRESVAASLRLGVEGWPGPVAVKVEPYEHDERGPVAVAATMNPQASGGGANSQQPPGKRKKASSGPSAEDLAEAAPQLQEARWIWMATPVRELPLDRRTWLHARPGLVSALGPLPGAGQENLHSAKTFDEFRFVGVKCGNNNDEPILFRPDGRVVSLAAARFSGAARVFITPGGPVVRNLAPPQAGRMAPYQVTGQRAMCNPLAPVYLRFTTPVFSSQIARGVAFTPDLAGGREDYDPWAQLRDYSSLFMRNAEQAFDLRLPERLKAFQEYRIASRAQTPLDGAGQTGIRDQFGRLLDSEIDLSFRTSHRLPEYRLPHRDAVLEAGTDSEQPLYATNLSKAQLNYALLNKDGAQTRLSRAIAIPPVEDVSFAVPLGVRAMLQGGSGALLGNVRGEPLFAIDSRKFNPFGRPLPAGDWRPLAETLGLEPDQAIEAWRNQNSLYFTQVTPYQVHAKAGHYNTLVWVTRLRTGQPVRGAEVRILRSNLLRLFDPEEKRESLAEPARTNRRGVAMLPGLEALDPGLETFDYCLRERYHPDCERLFVLVKGREGMALLPFMDSFLARIYRASSGNVWGAQRKRYGHMRAWGTTAQGIYRAGDTIHYKFYVRNEDVRRLRPSEAAHYTLRIEDPAGKTVHELGDIKLNEFGAAHGSYAVPQTAVAGWYRFILEASFTDLEWRPMRVLVSDFTPAPFRVRSELNGDLFGPGDTVTVATSAILHSGGAYTQAQARVVMDLRRKSFRSSHPQAAGFHFSSYPRHVEREPIHQEQGDLDDAGEHRVSIALPGTRIVHGRLRAESAVRDERGKYVAAVSGADYLAVDRLVGLRKDQWVFREGEPAQIQYIVVDERGLPAAGTLATLNIERRERKVAQVMGAGNAYLPRYTETWVAAGSCSGIPAEQPETCEFTPGHAGEYRVAAAIEDTQGRTHQSSMGLWVVGKGRVVWGDKPGYALELMADAAGYKVGDTARYLVKNPFPGALALVTAERFGVMDQWQLRLQGSTPVIEFRIKPDYVPGIYLSVAAVSPRVESPPPESHQGLDYVDMGKPAFRMGYARVPVADPYKQLAVNVETDRQIYKPGENVTVELRARPRHGPRQPVEFAVAVLDESVFNLIGQGKDYFDPHKGFYRMESPDVRNYGLLMRILGRQKFEKKGANAGGGGGGGPDLRTLLKYVARWEPSLAADSRGRAGFEFALPDNLTGWRVLALAATANDRFGLGEANFKTNLPTEIRPVMPNQVTEGDAFMAGFSVMNRTGEARAVDVVIEVEGDVAADAASRMERALALKPWEREIVHAPLRAGEVRGMGQRRRGEIRFQARAGDASDGDALAHALPVLKNRNPEVAAQYGSITDEPAVEPVLFPQDMQAGSGEVSVALAPSVLGNLEGAFQYMRQYPHMCWEQRLSVALAAARFSSLKHYLSPSAQWPESAGLPAQALKLAANYQAPNGGMAYWVAEDGRASPYLSAYTALAFAWLSDAGHEIPEAVESKLHDYLRRMLRRNLMPSYFSASMTSSVRAVALAALARRGVLPVGELRRYAPHAQRMSLFGKAHFLDAALHVPEARQLAGSVVAGVMDQAVASGGKHLFNEKTDLSHARILDTPLRANCALMSAFSRLENAADYGLDDAMASSMARALIRSFGTRAHWENTQENIFCMNALADYSSRWESVKPSMRASASLDSQPMGEARFNGFRDPMVALSLPIAAQRVGKSAEIRIAREGEGRLYYAARVAYSPAGTAARNVNAGIDARREYSVQRNGEWQRLVSGEAVQRGERVRVDLFLELPAARNFVVVDDPVPGGLEPLNRNLATVSRADAQADYNQPPAGSRWHRFNDWVDFRGQRWSFYHQELRHDAARFYSDHLPPGRYHLAYTAQAIASGEYQVRPTRAEEMYDIDVYGTAAPMRLKVIEPEPQ